MVEIVSSEESIILEFRKVTENDLKNISLILVTSDVPLTPKLQRVKKKVTQEGLMVEREKGGLCPFLGAQTPTHRGLCC